jgi:hypothetical protein
MRLRRTCGVFGVATAFAVMGAGQAFAADTKRPSIPANLVKTGATSTSISVKLSASSDNVGVTGYRVYRNGTLVTTTRSRRYTLSRLHCGSKYIVAVIARDAAGNLSLPAMITPSTATCPPACPTPDTVSQLLLEHKIAYACEWPHGGGAKRAVASARRFMTLRLPLLRDSRAKKWYRVALKEIDAALASRAWSSNGTLKNNAAGAVVMDKLLRVVRILHYHNRELNTATRAEKWAFTAIIWYTAASDYNARIGAGASEESLSRALGDILAAENEFLGTNAHGAAGRYVRAFRRMGGYL